MNEPESSIYVNSIYGAATRKGLVQITLINVDPSKPLIIEPDEARSVAASLLQCAEAAEGDHFMMQFFQDKLDMPVDQAAMILLEYREFRERQRQDES